MEWINIEKKWHAMALKLQSGAAETPKPNTNIGQVRTEVSARSLRPVDVESVRAPGMTPRPVA